MDNSNEVFNDDDLYGDIAEQNQPTVQLINAVPQHNNNLHRPNVLLFAVANHHNADMINALLLTAANVNNNHDALMLAVRNELMADGNQLIQADANVNNNNGPLQRPGF